MNFGGTDFILAIIAISTIGWVITSWIRAKHGYPVTDAWGDTLIPKDDPKAARQIETLSEENLRLKGQIDRLEDRLAVVERIATDPAERVAREIDQLR